MTEIETPLSEQCLIDLLDQFREATVVTTTVGRGRLARHLANSSPGSSVQCWGIDAYQSALAIRQAEVPRNLQFVCQPDIPEVDFDLAVVPLRRTGDAELARDVLQSAYKSLKIGGRLITAIDNRTDRWLAAEAKKLSRFVKRTTMASGAIYIVTKKESVRKSRAFDCELAFRDAGRLLKLFTRPGVFAHRKLDVGARQLLNSIHPEPGSKIVEIGCGSGAVSIGLAARDPGARVLAIDSNARAVQCTLHNAELNGLTNIQAEIGFDGIFGPADEFDLALANPPYYSDFRIAELFVLAAHRALRPDGRLVLVTKSPEWYLEHLPVNFSNVVANSSGQYQIVAATKPNW